MYWWEKAPCPKTPPLLHLIKLDKGFSAFLTLPTKNLHAGRPQSTPQVPKCHIYRAMKENSSRSQTPHQGMRWGLQPASIPAGSVTFASRSPYQFNSSHSKNLHPHNAQPSCAAGHTIISVWESHGTHWWGRGCPSFTWRGRRKGVQVPFHWGDGAGKGDRWWKGRNRSRRLMF